MWQVRHDGLKASDLVVQESETVGGGYLKHLVFVNNNKLTNDFLLSQKIIKGIKSRNYRFLSGLKQ